MVVDVESGGVVAPLESIFTDGAAGKPHVFVREPQGWAKRDVELGKKNYLSAAVRSGLRAGDVVATSRPPVDKSGNKQQ